MYLNSFYYPLYIYKKILFLKIITIVKFIESLTFTIILLTTSESLCFREIFWTVQFRVSSEFLDRNYYKWISYILHVAKYRSQELKIEKN